MKPYTDANKGNYDEDLRMNWIEDNRVRRKKKDLSNKKSYRKRLKMDKNNLAD